MTHIRALGIDDASPFAQPDEVASKVLPTAHSRYGFEGDYLTAQ